jgi:hypothetical protein
MSKLQILDLDFCQLVTEEDTQVTGGLSIFDLSQIKNLDPQLEGYIKTEVSSTPTSRLFKLEKPGSYGYKIETDDGKSKSSSLLLFGNNPDGIKTFASLIKTVLA